MSVQLLDARLETLAKDVEKVRTVVFRVTQRTEEINQIADSLHRSVDPLHRAKSAARHIISDTEGREDEIPGIWSCTEGENLGVLVETIIGSLKDVADLRNGAGAAVNKIAEEFVSLTEAQKTEITRGCNEADDEIKKLRNKLVNLTGAPDEARRLWADFDSLVEDHIQPLFTEYVDLVSGLAIRDIALDDQVCAMTDWLLQGMRLDGSVAVPASRATLGRFLLSVIKLGFPEWTIWGIPLVGHEVGLQVANNSRLQGLLEGETRYELTSRLRENLLADIFAAYTLGPCYAYAVMQLRLQPYRARQRDEDEPSDTDRAEVVLDVLERLNAPPVSGRPGKDPRYQAAVDQLKTFWTKEIGGPVPAGSPRSANLRAFVEKALETLADPEFRAFTTTRWMRAIRLLDLLDQGTEVAPAESAEILDLLTAAWQVRVEMKETGRERAERLAVIEDWVKTSAAYSRRQGVGAAADRFPAARTMAKWGAPKP